MTPQRCFLLALRTVAVPVTLTLFGGNAAMAQFAQTPIDITSQITTLAPYSNGIEYHYQTATVSLINTFGRKDEANNVIPKKLAGLKAIVPPGSYVIVEGIRYDLLQFHFHQPSEHTLNGNHLPMEVHFVHLREGTQDSRMPAPGFTDCALADRPALAIGVFIVPGNADREIQEVFAPPFLPVDSSSTPIPVNLNLSKLIPDGAASWRYLGGLSTPETTCNTAYACLPIEQRYLSGDRALVCFAEHVAPSDRRHGQVPCPVRRRRRAPRPEPERPARIPRPEAEPEITGRSP